MNQPSGALILIRSSPPGAQANPQTAAEKPGDTQAKPSPKPTPEPKDPPRKPKQ